MSERAEALAKQYEQIIGELAATIEKATPAQWSATCGAEGWTVAATAHHLAAQLPLEREFIVAATEGAPPPTYTMADINSLNEKRAQEHAACSKDDVLSLLRENTQSITAYVRGLSDAQLGATAPLGLANGAPVSGQQLIEGGVLIDHARGHLASIKAAG